MGFGNFPNPDEAFNQALQDALYVFQASTAISEPTGNYGDSTYQALRRYLTVNDPEEYAVDDMSCEWTWTAHAKGDPK
jgi:hypothetical protein